MSNGLVQTLLSILSRGLTYGSKYATSNSKWHLMTKEQLKSVRSSAPCLDRNGRECFGQRDGRVKVSGFSPPRLESHGKGREPAVVVKAKSNNPATGAPAIMARPKREKRHGGHFWHQPRGQAGQCDLYFRMARPGS